MKKTLTLPESDILALDTAAKIYGTVELAIAIGIGKSSLYDIIKGRNNKVTEESARKIKTWLDMDMDESDKKTAGKSKQEPTSKKSDKSRKGAGCPDGEPGVPEPYPWDDPKFLEIAVIELCMAIRAGRLRDVAITLGGHCKCGD